MSKSRIPFCSAFLEISRIFRSANEQFWQEIYSLQCPLWALDCQIYFKITVHIQSIKSSSLCPLLMSKVQHALQMMIHATRSFFSDALVFLSLPLFFAAYLSSFFNDGRILVLWYCSLSIAQPKFRDHNGHGASLEFKAYIFFIQGLERVQR